MKSCELKQNPLSSDLFCISAHPSSSYDCVGRGDGSLNSPDSHMTKIYNNRAS